MATAMVSSGSGTGAGSPSDGDEGLTRHPLGASVKLRRWVAALGFATGAVFMARCPDSNTVSGPARSATPLTPTLTVSATPSRTAPAPTSTPTSLAATPTPTGAGATLTGTG